MAPSMALANAPTSPPSDSLSTAERLRAALDREAIRWIDDLESQNPSQEGGEGRSLEWKERKERFSMAQDWLVRSIKMFPDASTDEREGDGIGDMREWMKDPSSLASIEAMFVAKGWVPPPPKRPGRPTKEESEQRERYKESKKALRGKTDADDDSGLQALLKGKTPKDLKP